MAAFSNGAIDAWAEKQPAQVQALLDAINGAAVWAAGHPDELAGLMAQVTGVPTEAQRVAAPRGVYAVQPLDGAIIARQQEIADTFARLKIIPAPIDIRKLVWTPPG
jgi:sulfonate transport system substrate-binding protein